MTRNQFIRLSGWGMMAAAVCLLLTFLSVPFAFLIAIGLVTLGLVGLRARYGARAGQWARLALRAGVLGGAAGVLSHLFRMTGHPSGRSLMNFSMAVMFAGLFVFGLLALRKRPMPRGNGLPALAGLWWPLIWINASAYQVAGKVGPEVPIGASFTIFCHHELLPGMAWLCPAIRRARASRG